MQTKCGGLNSVIWVTTSQHVQLLRDTVVALLVQTNKSVSNVLSVVFYVKAATIKDRTILKKTQNEKLRKRNENNKTTFHTHKPTVFSYSHGRLNKYHLNGIYRLTLLLRAGLTTWKAHTIERIIHTGPSCTIKGWYKLQNKYDGCSGQVGVCKMVLSVSLEGL